MSGRGNYRRRQVYQHEERPQRGRHRQAVQPGHPQYVPEEHEEGNRHRVQQGEAEEEMQRPYPARNGRQDRGFVVRPPHNDGGSRVRGRGGSRQRRGGPRLVGEAEGGGGMRRDQAMDGRGTQHSRVPHRQVAERRQSGGQTRFLTWDELKALASSTSETVVQAIVVNEAGFMRVFKHDRSCSTPRILKYLIAIIHQLVKSKEEALAARVLGQIFCGDGSHAQFCFQVDRLLKHAPTESNFTIKTENSTCLLYLIEIGLFGIEKIPKTMLDTFPKATLFNTVEELNQKGENVRILQMKCQELKEQFELAQEQVLQMTPTEGTDFNEELEPPNDFTTIIVLPQNDDLKGGPNYKPFLRPNLVQGGYRSWDHYLDVQFRLLREDFIAPLRDGIQSHYEGLCRRVPEIRVYEHVHVLTPVSLFTGIGFQISFSTQRLQRVNWEHSRRLIFGSLLCLSRDEFRESVIFATVIKRDPKELKAGKLTIKFEGNVNGFHIDPTHEYMMVESTAYFEAYRHVLLGLQDVSQVQDTMPFKRYLVDCNTDHIPPPLYVRSTGSACFNLSRVLDEKCSHTEIAITDNNQWPHFSMTNLDESQLEAIKMALQQEISVIQGPPGTGKTFIGLKLMQAFLQNRKIWDPHRNSPILVVCYTNHALDQFLEGIYDSPVAGKRPDIVRIGGRCKSAKLANCVLATKVQSLRSERSIPDRLHKRSRLARDDMNHFKSGFDEFQKLMNPSEGKLLPLSALQNVISDIHYLQLTQGMPTEAGREIEVWLKLWHPSQDGEEYEEYETQDSQDHVPQENSGNTAGISGESDSEDQYITVDDEARILQEQRMLEGEEIEFEEPQRISHVTIHAPPEPYLRQRSVPMSEWKTVQMSDKERKKRIERGLQHKAMKERKVQTIEDIRALDEFQRWQLYNHWVNQYLKQQKLSLQHHAEQYNAACRDYTETKQMIDCHVARGADVVGMTTTGAAKYHHILKEINPKIIIIEEAAEVFESHVITSLSPSVQQLILIGDHKQLRPKANCYKLEKEYNLAVSLFERLINNKIFHVTLEVQHRMRPEIASLICPAIYSKLRNAQKVKHYEHIGGVGKDLFFIDHTFPEKPNPDGDVRSHANIHEANYMVALCRYLLKQGYEQTQITLLTMYRGQLLEIKQRMKRKEFEGVRVAAVDDFQGEENDIILLSLVRSNSDGQIGFLKTENRICVSLSRARMGLYVIGNLSMLQSRMDTAWPKILSVVHEQKCIGEALLLCCQVHQDEKVRAKMPEDFNKCPEGGCQRPCSTRLKCGHTCTRLCHPWDRQHKYFKCQKPCNKPLPCGHNCKSKCYQCADACVPCTELVERVMPECGHTTTLQCHQNPMKTPCTMQCSRVLICGHFCRELCSEPCSSRCYVTVKKTLPCNHKIEAPCYLKSEEIECPTACNEVLKCGHCCEGTCGSCHQGRLHVRCQQKCDRQLVCGHICTFPCTAECPPCLYQCKNYCKHSKCPKKCYEPCNPCMEDCDWNCQHLRCTRKCGEICNRPPCNEPCLKLLHCGHPCIGLCGERCPNLCRTCNPDKVNEIFFGKEDEPDARFVELEDCGHILEYTGLDEWMKVSTENPTEVQLKGCPKCKTLIRRSLRYANQVKEVHNDFEKIKQKQLVFKKEELKQTLHGVMVNVQGLKAIKPDLENIESEISSKHNYIFPHRLNALNNQLSILPSIAKVCVTLAQVKCTTCKFDSCEVTIKMIHHQVKCLQRFLMQDVLFDQQLDDIECELRRLDCLSRLCDLYFKVHTRKINISDDDNAWLNAVAKNIYYSGVGKIPKCSNDMKHRATELIGHFNRQYHVEGLTKAERAEIVKAINLSKGHWFKCPNGHIYCIGECGGATQEAKCPECGAKIGGRNHRLTEGNQLAPEMDNAPYAAWSEGANMANYDLRRLQFED